MKILLALLMAVPVFGQDVMVDRLRLVLKKDRSAMRDVLATEEVRSWGEGMREARWKREVAMFREDTVPHFSSGIWPEREWSSVAEEFERARGVKFEGDFGNLERAEYHFSFEHEAVCRLHEKVKTLLFVHGWKGLVDCSGDLVTDGDLNPIRDTVDLFPGPARAFSRMQIQVEYSKVDLGEAGSLSVPVRIEMAAVGFGKRYYSEGTWTGYHAFYSKARVLAVAP